MTPDKQVIIDKVTAILAEATKSFVFETITNDSVKKLKQTFNDCLLARFPEITNPDIKFKDYVAGENEIVLEPANFITALMIFCARHDLTFPLIPNTPTSHTFENFGTFAMKDDQFYFTAIKPLEYITINFNNNEQGNIQPPVHSQSQPGRADRDDKTTTHAAN